MLEALNFINVENGCCSEQFQTQLLPKHETRVKQCIPTQEYNSGFQSESQSFLVVSVNTLPMLTKETKCFILNILYSIVPIKQRSE